MAVGKYSPTVVAAYQNSQTWWKPAGEFDQYDAEGYDSYGYNKADRDRADFHENAYLEGTWVNDNDYEYLTYQDVLDVWGVDENGQPCKRKHARGVNV
jgi:hypothetical protein